MQIQAGEQNDTGNQDPEKRRSLEMELQSFRRNIVNPIMTTEWSSRRLSTLRAYSTNTETCTIWDNICNWEIQVIQRSTSL